MHTGQNRRLNRRKTKIWYKIFKLKLSMCVSKVISRYFTGIESAVKHLIWLFVSFSFKWLSQNQSLACTRLSTPNERWQNGNILSKENAVSTIIWERSFIKTRNKTGPRTEPWGTLFLQIIRWSLYYLKF